MALAAEAGALPREGTALLVGAPGDLDTSAFGALRLAVLQEMMPDAARWSARGCEVVDAVPDRRFDAAVVFLPRSREAARDRIARAAAIAPRLLVDGQKTDGVEALVKEVRQRVPLNGVLSKAHGKAFWFDTDGAALSDWLAAPSLKDGWLVAPGVFSADGVDPGSALLAEALPADLAGRVADLGAGWGFLAGRALDRCPGITELHLVEAQASALDCARRNVADARARFHWADATVWAGVGELDAVIMNPPFHVGRTAETALGRNFIASAARLLRVGGVLWMVANRHLPYEQSLRAGFGDVTEIGGDTRYKLLRAVAASRKRRETRPRMAKDI